MGHTTLSEFADSVNEVMPAIAKEFLKQQTAEFYKTRITMPQFIVLDLLSHHGESRMTDLANYLHVTTAAMTGIVARLVRERYVSRTHDPKDRRIIRVSLTAKGNDIVKRAVENRKRMTMKLFGMVSQAEREEYLKILMHIRDHLKGTKE